MHDYNALSIALNGPLAPLTQYGKFVLWRLKPNPNPLKTKMVKQPCNVHGYDANHLDPAARVDVQTAFAAAQRLGCGVGFSFDESDPFVFIDVDECVVNGALNEFGTEVFNQFPGAAFEWSTSMTGYHLFTTATTLPPDYTGRTGNAIECYKVGRFVALTGYGAQGDMLTDRSPAVCALIAKHFGGTATAQRVALGEWTTGPVAEWQGPTDDAVLLAAFLSQPARVDAAAAFAGLAGGTPGAVVTNADLYNGTVALAGKWPDPAGGFDRSRAAFALATELAYWTGKDCERIDRIMRAAPWRRDKYDEQHDAHTTYGQWDILRACAVTERVRVERERIAAPTVEAAASFDTYRDEIAAAPDIHTTNAICERIKYDASITPQLREILAGDLKTAASNRGDALRLETCKQMVARVRTHAEQDRREQQKALNRALQLSEDAMPFVQQMTVEQMLSEFVYITDGSFVGSVSNPRMAMSLSDFRNAYISSVTHLPEGKVARHADLWHELPNRVAVATRTFRAGALPITQDPDGNDALNTWRYRPRGAVMTRDIQPFVDQVHYLFGDSTNAFLDWLAHIEQRPGQLPHFGFLHIADNTGTGRNWLASVISKLWMPYVAPNVDLEVLLGGGFNGTIAGKLIAIVDEIRTGYKDEARSQEGKMRGILTAEYREINPKYGRTYKEHNSCRWLLFSNHKNAIPLSANDRRWHVVHLTAPERDPAIYIRLYEELLRDDAFIDSIGVWLSQRDLSNFNAGQRAPMNDAKSSVIDASMTDIGRYAEALVKYWPCDLITAADIANVLSENTPMAKFTPAMRYALDDAGAVNSGKHMRYADGTSGKPWILRNINYWRANLSAATYGVDAAKMQRNVMTSAFNELIARM